MDAGIETVSGILEEECRDLNKRFFTFHEKKRPYLILKWAESKDGFIDQDFKPTKISNELASQFVHQIRSEEHAILVGTQTALNDNPSLTTRLVEGRNPVRILIDFDLKVPRNFKIYNDEAPTLVFNQEKEKEEGNIKFIKISKENFMEELMQKLYENQIQSVLVEGGSRTLQTFIDQNLWDETIIIKNEETKIEKLNVLCDDYSRFLTKYKLRTSNIETGTEPVLLTAAKIILLISVFPVFLVGFLLNALPFLTPVFIRKKLKIKFEGFFSSVQYGVAILVTFPLFYLIQTLLFAFISGSVS